MDPRSPLRPRPILPALLLALLVTRVWFLLGAVEETVVNDELVTGVTWSWLNGARGLGIDALWVPHVGGDTIYQLLALPLYALLGDVVLVPKLMALFTVTIGLILVVRVARHHGGQRAALWAGLLYVLIPPGFMSIQLVGVGDHYVVALVALGAGHLALLALRTDEPSRQDRLLAGLGALVGLGTFACYLNVVTWAALVPMLVVVRPRLGWRRRGVALGAAGLALGLAPLVANQIWHGSEATTIYERSLAEQVGFDPMVTLRRGASLLFVDLSRATWFRLDAIGQCARHTWFALAWLAAVACAWGQRRVIAGALMAPLRRRRLDPREAGLASYLLLVVTAFLGAWSMSDFSFDPGRPFGYRYLVVLLPPIVMFGGLAMARLAVRWPKGHIALGAVPLALALVGLAWPASFHDPARLLRLPGVTWTNHDMRAYERWREDLATNLAAAAPRMEVEQRAGFLVALGAQIARKQGIASALEAGATGLGDEDRTHLYRGILKDLAKDGHDPPEGTVRLLHSMTQQVPASARHPFSERLSGCVGAWSGHPDTLKTQLEGTSLRPDVPWTAPLLAEAWGGALAGSTPIAQLATQLETLEDDTLRDRAWFGAGYRTSATGEPELERLELAATGPPAPARAAFIAGMARGLRAWPTAREDLGPRLRLAAALPPELAAPFLRELGIAAMSGVDSSPYRLADSLGSSLPEPARVATCEGMGFGAGLHSKTLSDILRWRIDWDRHVGDGCSDAFDAGLERNQQSSYRDAPEFLSQRRSRLGLPTDATRPAAPPATSSGVPPLPADFPLSVVSWGGQGGPGDGASCTPITHHPVILVHDDGEGPEDWWRGPSNGTVGALERAGFAPCEVWAVRLGETGHPMRSVEELTDDLAFFMGSVLEYTGAPRVQLLAKGTGAVLTHATLAKYRLHDQVHAVVYVDAPFGGLEACDDARCFAGEVRCCSLQPGSLMLRRSLIPVQAPHARPDGLLRYLTLGAPPPQGTGGWQLAGAANHSVPALATEPLHQAEEAWSLVLEALQDPASPCRSEHDLDGDGYCDRAHGGADCDDSDAAVHPGAQEREADGVDQNCNGHEVDRRFPGWSCERPLDPALAELVPPGGPDLPRELRLLMLYDAADGDMQAALERCRRGEMSREPTPDRHPHAPPDGPHYVDLGFVAPSELDQPWSDVLETMERQGDHCALVQTTRGPAVLVRAQGSPAGPPP